LFGSDAEQQKFEETKPEQKQAKSPDFNGNQEIFGTSVHNDTPGNPHEIKVFGSRQTHFTN